MTWREGELHTHEEIRKAAGEVAAKFVGTHRRFDSHGGDTELNHHTGRTVEVLRPLTEEEIDLLEVGPMFEVRLNNGTTFHAFADEIEEARS